jgi:1,2-phenylacetyl-CoA epoxidase PaaB subunit
VHSEWFYSGNAGERLKAVDGLHSGGDERALQAASDAFDRFFLSCELSFSD